MVPSVAADRLLSSAFPSFDAVEGRPGRAAGSTRWRWPAAYCLGAGVSSPVRAVEVRRLGAGAPEDAGTRPLALEVCHRTMTGSRNRRPQLPRHPRAPLGPSPPSVMTNQPRYCDASAVQHGLSSRTQPGQQTPPREDRRVCSPSVTTRGISRSGTSNRDCTSGQISRHGQARQSSHPTGRRRRRPRSAQLTPTRSRCRRSAAATLPRTPTASRREAAIGHWPPYPNRASSSCASTALGRSRSTPGRGWTPRAVIK